ncbi:MAG: hypothetical protein NTY60_03300 [Proteobacteria bacterium]|nr:hypothetical protein [Pseudomonadota bacterium]
MATVLFFEKPGCGNNTRQKVWLAASGHTVLAKNLLKERWRKDELRPFFGDLPVVQWFNPSAPRIKSGEVNPASLDADTALSMMIKEPLLIRRPLMKAGDMYRAGFDADAVHAWIGLNDAKPKGNLEVCPNGQAAQPCPSPGAAK